MTHARQIAITLVLSILIWVVADQLNAARAELQVRIVLRPDPTVDNMTVRPDGGTLEHVAVVVSGQKRVIAEVRESETLTVPVSVIDRPTGQYEFDLLAERDKMRDHLRRLSVVSVVPRTIPIVVDHQRRVTWPVRLAPGTLEYVAPPRVDPAEVEVTISELGLAQIAVDRRYLTVDAVRYLDDWPQGKPYSESVPLPTVVDGVNLQPTPRHVRLQATVAERRKRATIAAVPIKWVLSDDLQRDFKIERRDADTLLTRAIDVIGPVRSVDQLVSGEVKVVGLLMVTAADRDVPGTLLARRPVFDLPAGVDLETEVAEVEFRLVPRAASTDR